MAQFKMTEAIRDSIMSQINQIGDYELCEQILEAHSDYYDAIVVYDFNNNEVRIESMPHNNVFGYDSPILILDRIEACPIDNGFENSDLFTDEELNLIDSKYDGNRELFFADNPEPSYRERCENAWYFYFDKNYYSWLDGIRNDLNNIIRDQKEW